MVIKKDVGAVRAGGSGDVEGKEDSELVSNRTDQEKLVIKQTGLLLKVSRFLGGGGGENMNVFGMY